MRGGGRAARPSLSLSTHPTPRPGLFLALSPSSSFAGQQQQGQRQPGRFQQGQLQHGARRRRARAHAREREGRQMDGQGERERGTHTDGARLPISHAPTPPPLPPKNRATRMWAATTRATATVGTATMCVCARARRGRARGGRRERERRQEGGGRGRAACAHARPHTHTTPFSLSHRATTWRATTCLAMATTPARGTTEGRVCRSGERVGGGG